MTDRTHSVDKEVAAGKRFEFGDNWRRFLTRLDEECIVASEQSLKDLLGIDTLSGKTFLDIGSGSGLSSLVARRLGASVFSLDYDPKSVACTRTLKENYFPDDPDWIIEQGSALDRDYLASLGEFDVVYSWGVLHHTGAMWRAIDNAASIVPLHSMFHIMIYQTRRFSSAWLEIKKFYNRCPRPLRVVLLYIFAAYDVTRTLLRGQSPIERARNYPVKSRGMSWFRDLEDWLGGLPYEHATSEEITNFMAERGFELRRRHNAEFVFSRVRLPSATAS